MMRLIHTLATAAALLPAVLLAACTPRPVPSEAAAPAVGDGIVVTLHPDRPQQTIHSFGASDAWSMQFVGEHWPAEKRERIADLLFSLEEDESGSPVGIGLSSWRFNIGAGSARQGRESGIRDPWRRTQSFLRADRTLNPEAQPGQRAFLREARDRGVEQFYAFVNSPPIALTRNGLAHSSGGDSANLAPERYRDFAEYLRDVMREVERQDGVAFDYLSPFNEPQWDWDGGQEGTPWRNDEIAAAVRVISEVLAGAGSSTQIEIPETARLNYLYEIGDKPTRGSQARAFFSPSSPHYVGGLPNLAKRVAAHSYFTTFPEDTLRTVRQRVREEIRSIDPSLEMMITEYCILENNEVIRGQRRDLGIDAALYLAGVIHADLVEANSTGWQWWLAVSPYDYKDGLVYISNDSIDGEIHESKMLWTLGHYSRFVRPGMQRIEVSAADPASANGAGADLLVSAYRDPTGPRTVAVVVNRGSMERSLDLRGISGTRVRLFRTTAAEGDDLALAGELPLGEPVTVPGRSIATIVID